MDDRDRHYLHRLGSALCCAANGGIALSDERQPQTTGTPSWAVIAAAVILTAVLTIILFIVLPALFGYHVYIEEAR